jgi:cell division inhibitor SulA/protein ImuA
MNTAVETLLQQPYLWRAGRPLARPSDAIPTGFAALDAELPAGGWPRGALTEIVVPQAGVGELRLLLPALARLGRQQQWLAWIAPPYVPYAPALAAHGISLSRTLVVHPRNETDTLWAIEQALRSGTCGAVLAWADALPSLNERHLRRLQLAAEAGRAWGVIFTGARNAASSSPAALRLRLEPAGEQTAVHILKRRGGWPTGPVSLDLEHGPTRVRTPRPLRVQS